MTRQPSRKRGILWSLIILALTTSAAGAAVPAHEAARPVARLPIELDEGLVLLEGRLAGGPALTLVVDTGASSTVFNAPGMEALGLELADPPAGMHAKAMTASGEVDLKFLAGPVQLELGGAPLEIAPAVAVPLDDLARRMGRTLHGILGRQLFQRYVVRVDYAARTLELWEPESFDAAAAGTEIPVELHHGAVPALEASIVLPDGRELAGTFLLDSGARTTLALNAPFVESSGVLETVETPLRMTSHGAAQEFEHQVARLAALRFAGFEIERPLARLSSLRSGALAGDTAAGVIGALALERFTVSWDLARRRLFLKPNDAYGEPDRMVSAGVSFEPNGEAPGRLEVREVVAGSPAAEQGIALGDRLLAIDGRPAGELDLSAIHRLLRQEGRDVRLRLARGGEELSVVVSPRDLIR